MVKNAEAHSIAYYISAHGYGHGVRSCQIIRAVKRLHPRIGIHVVSNLHASFLRDRMGDSQWTPRAEALDVGMVQRDSIRVDVAATLGRVRELYARRAELVGRESDFLRQINAGVVVTDIPAIPIEAAAALGIPSVAVGNFSWDWIYSEFVERDSGWREIVDVLKEQYSQAGLLLRLPFCGDMSVFPRILDIPLTAAPGNPRRNRITGLTGCRGDKKWALLSFTTLEWNEDALDAVARIKDYEFFTVRPLEWSRSNIHCLDRSQICFDDIVASMDVVVSKPGFGILSDCLVNQKPLIYADRSDFLEYRVLEAAIKKYLRFVHIRASDLYRGNLSGSLQRIGESAHPRESIGRGGDLIAANAIAAMVENPAVRREP